MRIGQGLVVIDRVPLRNVHDNLRPMAEARPNLDGPADLQGPRLHAPEALSLGMDVSLPKSHPIIPDFKSDITDHGVGDSPTLESLAHGEGNCSTPLPQ